MSDARELELQRLAAAGDTSARDALRVARSRRGACLYCGDELVSETTRVLTTTFPLPGVDQLPRGESCEANCDACARCCRTSCAEIPSRQLRKLFGGP